MGRPSKRNYRIIDGLCHAVATRYCLALSFCWCGETGQAQRRGCRVRAVSSVTALSHILVLVPTRTGLRAISDGSNLRFSDRQNHIAKSPRWRVRSEPARDLRTEHVLYSIVHTILGCHSYRILSLPTSISTPSLPLFTSFSRVWEMGGANDSQMVWIPYQPRVVELLSSMQCVRALRMRMLRAPLRRPGCGAA